MSALDFKVAEVRVEKWAAVPTLVFALDVTADGAAEVENVALRCQIRIEPQRRRYAAEEEALLGDVFGDPPRWGDTLKPFLWTHVQAVVTRFTGRTRIELPVPCSYDLEVAAGKYFHALREGEVPLIFLFSGTIFQDGPRGLAAQPLPWDREATFRLPVAVWRQLMDQYFPDAGYLRLGRQALDDLLVYKASRALPDWNAVIVDLLARAAGPRGAA